jgi:hypothetical protein
MIEHDFDEDFVPIAAELQRLPYLSPSRDFADRVISRIDRLHPGLDAKSIVASRHLELQQGGQQPVVRRRSAGLARGTAKATAVVGLLVAASFMFFEIDVLTAILSAAASQYAFAIAAIAAQVGTLAVGADTIAFLQAGALEAVVLYVTLAAGLFGGYAAIRTAAHIARRKAA